MLKASMQEICGGFAYFFRFLSDMMSCSGCWETRCARLKGFCRTFLDRVDGMEARPMVAGGTPAPPYAPSNSKPFHRTLGTVGSPRFPPPTLLPRFQLPNGLKKP